MNEDLALLPRIMDESIRYTEVAEGVFLGRVVNLDIQVLEEFRSFGVLSA